MPPHVLIVDDETNLRLNLAAFLEDSAMDVSAVSSGEAALDLIHGGHRFDVCIMDMRLPGMDGNEAIRALHDAAPAMRFIIHTGSTGYALPEDLASLGVTPDCVFQKPVADMNQVTAVIERLSGRPSA